MAPIDAPVPVDFVIPPKPPLPPRATPQDADRSTAVDEVQVSDEVLVSDEVIVPDEAPVEAASPEVLDEVPVVTATGAATEQRAPEPADAAPVEIVEVEATVEVVEEVPEADDETPDDAVAPASAAVVVETTEDEASERLFADVAERAASADEPPLALEVSGLAKSYGSTVAVAGIDLAVPAGTFYGLVGPNGAGKTTTLSMIAGLLKPDAGTIRVAGVDARTRSREAKRLIGVLPDRFRTFDRLTGRQLLSYAGLLRGLDANTVERRASDLGRAFDLTSALGRSVSDYSAGMTKKIMLAAALIHSPRLLVLDEPFEAVDPVSSSVILDILGTYVSHGGTVLLSSHGMDLVERVCDRVAVIVSGQVLVDGTVAEVRGEQTLEARFLELVGGSNEVEGLEWLHTFSD
ncbi:ABC transporter ATP-binding protein [Microbacterium sp. RG1]|uniref:ABC transporter ATP-binding protein n=1 Tax=Microbacterium sp. RG1 TaxID=2489212 RepID=UPI0010CA5453|nr:ABC transporter ATP-binding protein [Microbacterium sp. RG1]QCQ16339.1 ABC transporter ATP-binding protein [Microbacterium sp. RG1]